MRLLAAALTLTLVPFAQAADKGPLAELPYSPSLDLASLDRTVPPCVDFYQFACGGWIKRNPIPPDQARWDVYGKLQDENERYLWGLLLRASQPDPGRSPARQKIGDYFASCIDEPALEKTGATPLRADLAAIAGLRSRGEIAALLARLHPTLENAEMLFGFGADIDPKDSTAVIAWAVAGGLGLPDRDYYVKDDAKSVEIRERYRAHVGQMLELVGDPPAAAARQAAIVLRLETALARAALTRVARRDPYQTYHKMTRAELQALTPAFRWDDYLSGVGQGALQVLNVSEPEFYRELGRRLSQESLADWQTYLRWHLVHARAPYLSAAFVKQDFAFYLAYLRGVPEAPPRAQRCVQWVDRDLGEALGAVFVEQALPPGVKPATLEMVTQIERVMQARLERLPWMSEATRAQALEKLRRMRNKIGYPERFRDYSALEIRRDGFLDNVLRGIRFENQRQLGKLGKPVDRDEWTMTPPTVNAYYNASMNDMNFPAGVLLPPLFDLRLDIAPSYGNTGATIGHELIHGFDDSGRRFDAAGNLRDWWTPADAQAFEQRAACVADQYAGYTVVDEIKINSRLTLGEDVADLAGTVLAFQAWQEATRSETLTPGDGLTPEQRFFVGFAQWACTNERAENKRVNALTNPHSPGEYRINGVVVNMPEFRQAFACQAGQPMVKEPVCQIW